MGKFWPSGKTSATQAMPQCIVEEPQRGRGAEEPHAQRVAPLPGSRVVARTGKEPLAIPPARAPRGTTRIGRNAAQLSSSTDSYGLIMGDQARQKEHAEDVLIPCRRALVAAARHLEEALEAVQNPTK